MRSLAIGFFAVLMATPSASMALTTYSYSESSTGGITVQAGGSSSGSSDSSVEVNSAVNQNNGTGTSHVEITTVQNGVKHTESHHQTIPPGGSVTIVATSTGATSTVHIESGGAWPFPHVISHVNASATTTSQTEIPPIEAAAQAHSFFFIPAPFLNFFSIFSHLFGW